MSKPRQADPLFEPDYVDTGPQRPAIVRWALNDWPYTLMLLLALGGVSWATFTDHPAVWYWAFLSPVFGVICVAAGWRHVSWQEDRLRLVYTQALHWLGVLLAMLLIAVPSVSAVVNDNATGLALMTILALGTFLAGLWARAWRICIVGVFLAVAVPVIAWLDQSAMFLTLVAFLLIGVGGFIWWRWRR
jgi:hypothetical protein